MLEWPRAKHHLRVLSEYVAQESVARLHSVGVCQIVRPVGALRQNPSNAARQIRPESGPTTSRQMLTLSEAPSDRSYTCSYTVTAHTQPQFDLSGKPTSRVVALPHAPLRRLASVLGNDQKPAL